jgi:ribonuclease HI
MSSNKEKILVYTDGGSRGNPGPAGIGVVIANEKEQVIKKYSKDIGERTNNEAEYEAVIFAMQKLKHLFGKEKAKNFDIEIRMDSELVCRQLKGEYKIKEEKLFPLFIKIWNLRMDFGKISFKEIPRSKNKEADALANEAMDSKINQTKIF